MSTIRFFSGGREPGGKRSIAAEIMRIEVQKNGKLPSTDRFKMIFKQRMEESRKKVLEARKAGLKRVMSKSAESALKEVAQRKAAKEARALRKMVIVQPRNFHNGSIVKSGKVYDIAGNTVARVNTKNGKIFAGLGIVGRYKSRSIHTNTLLQNTIDKYSPYYINLRKMQAMQQGASGHGVWGDPHAGHDAINIYGRSAGGHSTQSQHLESSSGVYGDYSGDMAGPRQNVGATAWGAMSDSVFGVYTDNVWGTSTDTVWGTNTSDVWGGIGGNPWGNHAKSVRIWGSGDGHNYLKGLAARVAAFFGLHLQSQASRASFHEAVNGVRNSRLSAHEQARQGTRTAMAAADHHVNTAATTRASAPPPTTTRR